MTGQGPHTVTRRRRPHRRLGSWRAVGAVVVVAVATMVGAVLPSPVGATERAGSERPPTSLLFALSGSAATITPVAGSTDRYDFTVTVADPTITWFTDRPVRRAGVTTPSWFAAQWDAGEQFAADPPNAAVVLHNPAGANKTVVVDVTKLRFDPATRSFTGEVRRLSRAQAKKVQGNLALGAKVADPTASPQELGAVTVFVDPLATRLTTLPPDPVPTPPLAITTTSPLPTGTGFQNYSTTLTATGGNPPYTWHLYSGSLPVNLTLNPDGTITGKSGGCNVWNFTVMVVDVNGINTDAPFSLAESGIAGCPS